MVMFFGAKSRLSLLLEHTLLIEWECKVRCAQSLSLGADRCSLLAHDASAAAHLVGREHGGSRIFDAGFLNVFWFIKICA